MQGIKAVRGDGEWLVASLWSGRHCGPVLQGDRMWPGLSTGLSPGSVPTFHNSFLCSHLQLLSTTPPAPSLHLSPTCSGTLPRQCQVVGTWTRRPSKCLSAHGGVCSLKPNPNVCAAEGSVLLTFTTHLGQPPSAQWALRGVLSAAGIQQEHHAGHILSSSVQQVTP